MEARETQLRDDKKALELSTGSQERKQGGCTGLGPLRAPGHGGHCSPWVSVSSDGELIRVTVK